MLYLTPPVPMPDSAFHGAVPPDESDPPDQDATPCPETAAPSDDPPDQQSLPQLDAALRQEALQWARAAVAAAADTPTVEANGAATPGGTVHGALVGDAPTVPLPPPRPALPRETRAPRPWWASFLAAYAVEGEITSAADAAGIDRDTVYYWVERSTRFRNLMAEAKERSTRLARRELFTRAVVGWTEPVFFGGEVVGHKVMKSDRCLELLLKSRDPAFRDKVDLTHAGPTGGPVRVETTAEITHQLAPYQDASRMLLDALLSERELSPRPVPALPAPITTATVSDCGAESRADTPETAAIPHQAGVGLPRPCPRCDGPGVNPYCAVCHGSGAMPG